LIPRTKYFTFNYFGKISSEMSRKNGGHVKLGEKSRAYKCSRGSSKFKVVIGPILEKFGQICSGGLVKYTDFWTNMIS